MPSLASLLARRTRPISRMSSCHVSLAALIERRMLFFIVRSESGALDDTFSAHATAAASSLSLGTTSCTIPIASARWALTGSAV